MLREGQETRENFLTSCVLKMGPKVSPETSVRNYHFALRIMSEERISQNNLVLNEWLPIPVAA
jgi:hypothetical protein